MKIRRALPHELESVFLMGYEFWHEGKSIPDYLEMYRSSPKYAGSRWYVLEVDGKIVSSMFVSDYGEHRIGLGSIATAKDSRGRGYASSLIEQVTAEYEAKDAELQTFLYSEIPAEFYAKLKFRTLPENLQKYKTSVAMIRGPVSDLRPQDVPDYF